MFVGVAIIFGCGRNEGRFARFQFDAGSVVVVYLGSVGDCVSCTAFPSAFQNAGNRSGISEGIRTVGVIECSRKIELDAFAGKSSFDTVVQDDGSLKEYRERGVRIIVVNRSGVVVGTLSDEELHQDTESVTLAELLRTALRQ